jgi:prephenate dehydratase
MRIVTLGPKGTFSEEAALLYQQRCGAQKGQSKIEFDTILGCFEQLEAQQVDRIVLPAENMVDGIIGLTFDLLLEKHDFIKVCDEVHVKIRHVLASRQGEASELTAVLSHPSALNQCAHNLAAEFPHLHQIPVSSTGEAALRAKKEESLAALCSPSTARQYGLKIIRDQMEDYPQNQTRFFVCALTDTPPSGQDRTLIAVRFGDNFPGQLAAITQLMAEHRIDLTFVQSRPYKIKPQDYVLCFEMEGHRSDCRLKQAFAGIEAYVRKTGGWKRILGSYPRRESEELIIAAN